MRFVKNVMEEELNLMKEIERIIDANVDRHKYFNREAIAKAISQYVIKELQDGFNSWGDDYLKENFDRHIAKLKKELQGDKE